MSGIASKSGGVKPHFPNELTYGNIKGIWHTVYLIFRQSHLKQTITQMLQKVAHCSRSNRFSWLRCFSQQIRHIAYRQYSHYNEFQWISVFTTKVFKKPVQYPGIWIIFWYWWWSQYQRVGHVLPLTMMQTRSLYVRFLHTDTLFKM